MLKCSYLFHRETGVEVWINLRLTTWKCNRARTRTWDLPIIIGTLYHLSNLGTITWQAHSRISVPLVMRKFHVRFLVRLHFRLLISKLFSLLHQLLCKKIRSKDYSIEVFNYIRGLRIFYLSSLCRMGWKRPTRLMSECAC